MTTIKIEAIPDYKAERTLFTEYMEELLKTQSEKPLIQIKTYN